MHHASDNPDPTPVYNDAVVSAVDSIPAEVLLELPLGVHIRHAAGRQSYHCDEDLRLWKEIGRVTMHAASGRIEIWPYVGISDFDLERLNAVGLEAWTDEPSTGTGWHQHQCSRRGLVWWVAISVELDGMPVDLVQSDRLFHAAADREFFQAYRVDAPDRHGSAA